MKLLEDLLEILSTLPSSLLSCVVLLALSTPAKNRERPSLYLSFKLLKMEAQEQFLQNTKEQFLPHMDPASSADTRATSDRVQTQCLYWNILDLITLNLTR